jgi:GNAT superfamily N-acetyltransferase
MTVGTQSPLETPVLDPQAQPAVRIRPATESDIGTILGFIRELADYEKLSHEVVATEASLHEHLFGPKPKAEVLLVCLEEQPVGFALFFYTFSTFLGRPGLYLEDLYIQTAHRGRGFGGRLLRYLAQLSVQRGCGRLEWSVLDWNTPAIRFYESLGAVPMDEWTVNRLTGKALTDLASQSSSSC